MFVSEGLQSPTAEIILNAISRHLGNMASPDTTHPSFKKRKLSEPSQTLLNSNLLTSRNLLASNLTPLLQSQLNRASTPYNPLSFTPLMFRQFPALSPSSSFLSQFSSPSFKPSSAFASQLLNLASHPAPVTSTAEVSHEQVAANKHVETSRDLGPVANQRPEMKQECTSPGQSAVFPAPAPVLDGKLNFTDFLIFCSAKHGNVAGHIPWPLERYPVCLACSPDRHSPRNTPPLEGNTSNTTCYTTCNPSNTT